MFSEQSGFPKPRILTQVEGGAPLLLMGERAQFPTIDLRERSHSYELTAPIFDPRAMSGD